MTVSVLIPYGQPDGETGEWRNRSFEWVRARWKYLCPGYEVIVAAPDRHDDPGRFNRPQAINRAAARASGDVLIIADADTAFDEGWPASAVDAVTRGGAPWVLPYIYRKLDRDSTADLVRKGPTAELTGTIEEQTEFSWSGLVVVSRVGFETVGGFDERFTGWGHDDIAFGLCAEALIGHHRRPGGQALHLWHPTPLEHNYGHATNGEQYALAQRYIAATDESAMREVRFG